MSEHGVLIQWNLTNWVTVVLMVTIMFFASGLISAFLRANLPKFKNEEMG